MSREAASLLGRLKSFARNLRTLSQLEPDLLQTYTNTGVAAEVTALSDNSLVQGDGVDTDTTAREYQDFILTVTEFGKYYNEQTVTSQDNASFTQNLLQGA